MANLEFKGVCLLLALFIKEKSSQKELAFI